MVIGVAIRSCADLSLRILRHLPAQGGMAGAYGKDDVAPLSLIQKGDRGRHRTPP
jgi:hypothetical protein